MFGRWRCGDGTNFVIEKFGAHAFRVSTRDDRALITADPALHRIQWIGHRSPDEAHSSKRNPLAPLSDDPALTYAMDLTGEPASRPAARAN
jgi:hypothetical protein